MTAPSSVLLSNTKPSYDVVVPFTCTKTQLLFNKLHGNQMSTIFTESDRHKERFTSFPTKFRYVCPPNRESMEAGRFLPRDAMHPRY